MNVYGFEIPITLASITFNRQADKYGLGVVAPYEFKAAVEKILGYNMTHEQWTNLKIDVKLDGDGLVPYAAFLDTFSARLGCV